MTSIRCVSQLLHLIIVEQRHVSVRFNAQGEEARLVTDIDVLLLF